MVEQSTPVPDRYIREAECHAMSGLERSVRYRMEKRGEFPRRRQLSERSVGWLLSEIVEWMASRGLPAAFDTPPL